MTINYSRPRAGGDPVFNNKIGDGFPPARE